jgi:hypothetical protein
MRPWNYDAQALEFLARGSVCYLPPKAEFKALSGTAERHDI